MLLTENVLVKWNPKVKKWYEDKEYVYTKIGEEFLVKVKDLTLGSHAEIKAKCDCVDCKNPIIKSMTWRNYIKFTSNNGKYYCKQCISKERIENGRLTKLKNSISFKQWCIDNNRQDLLDRWDYELNCLKPDEISYGSQIKIWFKCPKNLHSSELKDIHSFVGGQIGSLDCNKCNSFAQWGIDNLGDNFLEKCWNKDNIIDPWEISKGKDSKVWINCQENKDHKSYNPSCKSFTGKNSRCPICNESKGEKECRIVFIKNNFIEITESDYYNLLIKDNHKYLISQKTFLNLLGLGGGFLSYDFYLPKYNLLIEYQGEFHDGTAKLQTEEEFIIQKEHDKRKKEYAISNKYNFLVIWYWDFDNIETILSEYLNNITS